MSIDLTETQQQALDNEQEQPPRLVDPRTNAAYVLVKEDEYKSLRELLKEDQWRGDLHAVALRNAVGRMVEDR